MFMGKQMEAMLFDGGPSMEVEISSLFRQFHF